MGTWAWICTWLMSAAKSTKRPWRLGAWIFEAAEIGGRQAGVEVDGMAWKGSLRSKRVGLLFALKISVHDTIRYDIYLCPSCIKLIPQIGTEVPGTATQISGRHNTDLDQAQINLL